MDTASLFLTNDSSSEVLDSLWASNSSPPLHGSMVNFEEAAATTMGGERQELYGQQTIDPKVEVEDYDFQPAGKKRRLSVEQVQFLEKSFEVENKLEPDRKVQLAKELGLQTRQVAIWFQNRRARFKTKLLEKEYDALKSSYDKLKAEYDNLYKENEKTKNEVNLLTEKLMRKTASVAAESEGSPRSAVDSEEGEMGLGLGLGMGMVGKVEELYEEELQPNSCNLGFPVQDKGTWFWQY